ncbi:hypothetical protein K7X08_008594 [Anisodus acutangulus]|uniref:Uncharacterized protein n=1 Tax=Anisodus acutangulus TaxID=402998 RepID=A0A9Q1RQ52_9SOLA|nr:hypothetical protein K7X08_008594 [Anisodus acutangulus]
MEGLAYMMIGEAMTAVYISVDHTYVGNDMEVYGYGSSRKSRGTEAKCGTDPNQFGEVYKHCILGTNSGSIKFSHMIIADFSNALFFLQPKEENEEEDARKDEVHKDQQVNTLSSGKVVGGGPSQESNKGKNVAGGNTSEALNPVKSPTKNNMLEGHGENMEESEDVNHGNHDKQVEEVNKEILDTSVELSKSKSSSEDKVIIDTQQADDTEGQKEGRSNKPIVTEER